MASALPHPDGDITDAELRALGFDPEEIERSFEDSRRREAEGTLVTYSHEEVRARIERQIVEQHGPDWAERDDLA